MPKEPPRRRLIAMEGIEERREDGGGARKLVLAEDRDEHKRGRANRRHFLPHRGLLESQSKPPAPPPVETDGRDHDGRAGRTVGPNSCKFRDGLLKNFFTDLSSRGVY